MVRLVRALRLLLDTCTLLQATGVDKALPRPALDVIKASDLFVSTVSRIEIAIKVGNGKLDLLLDGERVSDEFFWNESIRRLQPEDVLPIVPDHLRPLSTLPKAHKDPFDRMLICQAMSLDLPIMTTDENFALYEVSVVDPARLSRAPTRDDEDL